MDTDFDFSDDFFNDDDEISATEAGSGDAAPSDAAASRSELDVLLSSLTNSHSNSTEIMLLYDEGSLKENLRKCLTQTDYYIIEAYDLGSARDELRDHPKLSLIIANSTVAGDDAASILRSLVTINPDLICIICTDMIDQLAFTALINTAPVYKILTFPLDIDLELIPALDEMASASMVRSVNREEWNSLVRTNEDLARQLRDALHFSRIRQGTLRRLYNGMVEILAKATTERCNDPFGNTTKTVKQFQKRVVDKFFLSHSSNDIPMEKHIKGIMDAFDKKDEGRTIKITCNDDTGSDPLLRARISFIIWLLFYRLSLTGSKYSGTAEIKFKDGIMALIDVSYIIDPSRWRDINNNTLQKSYTSVVEGLANALSSAYVVSDRETTRSYSMTVNINTEE